MNTKKHKSGTTPETPNSKLQKSSVIFMQLGLIIALLLVYITLEHKSIIKYGSIIEMERFDPDTEITQRDITIEKPKPKIVKKLEPKKVVVVKIIEKVNLIENNEKVKDDSEKKLFDMDSDVKQVTTKPTINLDFVPDDLPDTNEDPIPFILLEDAPEFPGCKGNKEQKKICFNKKMSKHINRYLNVDLLQDISGLRSGKNRLNVQFIINKQGDIENIRVATKHLKLEKEAKRLINKLPKMIPGKQRNKPVKVKFTLPIIFNIE
jgi:protein TonB